MTHLQGKISDLLTDIWAGLLAQTFFFPNSESSLNYIGNLKKSKAREVRMLERETIAKLETITASLHEDPYNIGKQGEVGHLQGIMTTLRLTKQDRPS